MAIIERKNMREELGKLLRLHSQKAAETFASKASMFQADPIEEKNSDKENKKEKSAWERVELSRSPARCTAGDYIDQIFEDFTELHGDRCFGDDGAVIGGIATLSGIPVTVIGQQKGKKYQGKYLAAILAWHLRKAYDRHFRRCHANMAADIFPGIFPLLLSDDCNRNT